MATGSKAVIQQVKTLFQLGTISGLSDDELLERFNQPPHHRERRVTCAYGRALACPRRRDTGVARASSPCLKLSRAGCPCHISPSNPLAQLIPSRLLSQGATVEQTRPA
jgi:hypothetical protein